MENVPDSLDCVFDAPRISHVTNVEADSGVTEFSPHRVLLCLVTAQHSDFRYVPL
jgi:hypothetical protein